MKTNIIRYLGMLVTAVGLTTSCNEDPKYFTLDTPEDQMQLTASVTDIELQKAYKQQTAVTFNWNNAAVRGNGDISYSMRLYRSDFPDDVIESTKELTNNTVEYTHEELNNLLYEWGVTTGVKTNIVAELIANINDSEKYYMPEISYDTISVVGYDARETVFMVLPQDDGTNQYVKLNSTSDISIYKWYGRLTKGEIWFSTTETGAPAYMRGSDNDHVEYSENGEGTPFTITENAYYNITLNLKDYTIKIEKIPSLYLVQTENGNINATEMKIIDNDSLYYHWSGKLPQGAKIRFATDKENGMWPAYVPNGDGKLQFSEEGAGEIEISETGTYELVVCLSLQTFICKQVYDLPEDGMWAVGDATKAGWDAGSKVCAFKQEDLKHHPEYWSCTTGITAGLEFKLITRSGQWNYEFLRRDSETGSDPYNTWLNCGIRSEATFATEAVSGDNKFTPTSSGTYKIIADLHNMRLIMIEAD
ncbi:MAG: SusE domain-containing protein [Prevotella sp.]|jgi:hypothetical protein